MKENTFLIEGTFTTKLDKDRFAEAFKQFLKENRLEFEGFHAPIDAEKYEQYKNSKQ